TSHMGQDWPKLIQLQLLPEPTKYPTRPPLSWSSQLEIAKAYLNTAGPRMIRNRCLRRKQGQPHLPSLAFIKNLYSLSRMTLHSPLRNREVLLSYTTLNMG